MNWAVLADVGRILGYANLAVVPFGIFGQVMFYRAAQGTYRRYVMKSLFHAYLIIEVFVGPLMLIGYIIDGDRLWMGLYCAIVPLMFWNLYTFRRDHGDEDDFWKGLGGRVKAGLRRRIRILRPAHQGAS